MLKNYGKLKICKNKTQNKVKNLRKGLIFTRSLFQIIFKGLGDKKYAENEHLAIQTSGTRPRVTEDP
jgi:hypothetical protein